MDRIQARLLIPGRGDPIPDGVVVLDGAQISYAGPAAAAPATPGADSRHAAAVMPGMWDCHGHFLGSRVFDLAKMPLEPLALRAVRSARDLRAALDAGITSVREVGGLGIDLARVVAEGLLDGPAIYAAGAILSTTGGHADLHSYPLGWMADYSVRDGAMRLADGADGCMRAVREQLRRNARVIKICASGGVLSELNHPIHQQFTKAELHAIVEVAGLAESWCRPGQSSRTSWPTWPPCRTTRPPSSSPSPTCTPRRWRWRCSEASRSRWAPTSA